MHNPLPLKKLREEGNRFGGILQNHLRLCYFSSALAFLRLIRLCGRILTKRNGDSLGCFLYLVG